MVMYTHVNRKDKKRSQATIDKEERNMKDYRLAFLLKKITIEKRIQREKINLRDIDHNERLKAKSMIKERCFLDIE